jgi:hypothetical protein
MRSGNCCIDGKAGGEGAEAIEGKKERTCGRGGKKLIVRSSRGSSRKNQEQ